MGKSERAAILSLSSLLKSLFLMIFAPVLGFIADRFGISMIMFMLAVVFLLAFSLLRDRK